MNNKLVVYLIGGAVLVSAIMLFTTKQSSAPMSEDHTVPLPAAPGETANSDTLPSPKNLAVTTEDVVYFGGTKGLFARPIDTAQGKQGKPEAPGSYPGVVMIHEWWGLNDNIKDMAQKLAGEGYLVLAVDLYEGKAAATADEARKLTSGLDQKKALENLRAAAAYLRKAGAPKVASLGWCFGGGQSLELALSGEKLDATVIYYGRLVTDKTKLQNVMWPVLGIFGQEDGSIPVSTVHDFEDALTSLGTPAKVHIYPGVGHAFANPSGANYAPAETADAWEKTLAFLAKHLRGE